MFKPTSSPVSVIAIAFLFTVALAGRASAATLTIPTVPVGNPGNAPDPLTGNVFGSVSYNYRIGTTEVTNAQYAAFLNAKAASDPLQLYNASIGVSMGITRSGVNGSFTYSVKPNMADKPVNYVSWYDAIRFANWLHNGQGAGDTETGAYTILGGTPTPSNGLSITRNPGATWFLPSEDEWYKAAYHQPAAQGGDADDYWLYPTKSNSAPTIATADSVGNISNPGANVANYNLGADWNSQNGNLTTVGSAGPLSESYYGTSDQGGNVYEWTEALHLFTGTHRRIRGGTYNGDELLLQSPSFFIQFPESQSFPFIGFRVATIAVVPEPSTWALAVCGVALGLLVRRRQATSRRRGVREAQFAISEC